MCVVLSGPLLTSPAKCLEGHCFSLWDGGKWGKFFDKTAFTSVRICSFSWRHCKHLWMVKCSIWDLLAMVANIKGQKPALYRQRKTIITSNHIVTIYSTKHDPQNRYICCSKPKQSEQIFLLKWQLIRPIDTYMLSIQVSPIEECVCFLMHNTRSSVFGAFSPNPSTLPFPHSWVSELGKRRAAVGALWDTCKVCAGESYL